ncbi:Na+-transporting NADH:ubiquinone oxidoreductase subunit C [Anaerosolibacter carboniphilus]|uniref:Na+-transporting NADH:ubiquinone oxidoreductase subunit C n=1 Tax=Anaerosolibacter carboniphilus TaxID=1417629 RepID=A0A841KYF4_9FIRM|nr:FMN-binding protein [Anaerosolibacter carboniphilus]MBB6215942.1 Na+-transporting NADH:ubiquinone oxidoreductase subunit C [Anaerosolibacter carboniphilus]
MKKGSLYSILFMMVITAVFTFALSALHQNTIVAVQGNQLIKNQKKILYAFNIPFDDTMKTEEINTLYNTHIKESKRGDLLIYEGYIDDQLQGYATEMEGPGLWGNIHGVIAINKDLDAILGVDFLTHSETPGLGGRIDEQWFKEQFRNIPLNTTSPYVLYRPSPDGTVDAIAGATLTSKAVLDIVNDSLNQFLDTERGGK